MKKDMRANTRGQSPLILLTGGAASGKTTLQRRFLQRNPQYSKVITYTTRPIRAGEVDGVDYHFVAREDFLALKERDFFAETDEYRGGFLYGSPIGELKENKIATLTPSGLRALRARGILNGSVELFSVYLDAGSMEARLLHAFARGDDPEAAYRAAFSDEDLFQGIEHEVDLVIRNPGYEMDADSLARLLEEAVGIAHEAKGETT